MNETPGVAPVTVAIADDQHLVRDGIASVLALYEDLDVVGTAARGSEAITLARQKRPQVFLMDIRMPGMEGLTAAATILSEGLASHVVMLTTFDDEEYVIRAIRLGASGYLLKDLPPEELHQAILAVRRGVFWASREVMGKMGRILPDPRTGPGPPRPELQQLSLRERQVLHLVGRGATNGEIAKELSLTEGTVKNYVSTLLDTLGFRDRVQAALFAASHLEDPPGASLTGTSRATRESSGPA